MKRKEEEGGQMFSVALLSLFALGFIQTLVFLPAPHFLRHLLVDSYSSRGCIDTCSWKFLKEKIGSFSAFLSVADGFRDKYLLNF